MEQLVTANREKAEAIQRCGELQIALDRANKDLSTERRKNIVLQANCKTNLDNLSENLDDISEGPPVDQPTGRCSGDFAADDAYCVEMGISDTDSSDTEDLLGAEAEWKPTVQAAVPVNTLEAPKAAPTPSEQLELVKQALMRVFGTCGARKAFIALGEKGGKITKQNFYDTVDKVCGDETWTTLSSRQKSAIWEKVGEEEGNLKNGALYFEAFARVFFGIVTRPRSNTTN